MEKLKIIIFGDLPVASKIAEYIINSNSYILKYVVIGNKNPNKHDPYNDFKNLESYANDQKIEIISFDRLINKNESFDLGISIRFSKKIPKELIDLFRFGIVNLHPGLLPEFAGLYSEIHTILQDSERGGGTMHWITEKIDLGPIITIEEFAIRKNDTTYKIYQETTKILYKMIIKFLDEGNFTKERDKLIPEKNYTFYNKYSLNNKKDLSQFMNKEQITKIDKYARAFSFPGHEPAFLIENGKKLFIIPEDFF